MSLRAVEIGGALSYASIASIPQASARPLGAAASRGRHAAPCTPTSAAPATTIEETNVALLHPTLDLLHDLGLHFGIRPKASGIWPITRRVPRSVARNGISILLEHESTLRQQKRFEARAKTARLRHQAAIEDVDYRNTARTRSLGVPEKLAGCDWIREKRHCLP